MSDNKCAICSAPAQHKCSACKLVSYCSKEHQKKDWKKHKEICRPFEVLSSPEIGRYLVATRDLKPGDLLLSEVPLVVGPKIRDAAPSCLNCLRRIDPNPSTARCPLCLWLFCTPTCPTDPKVHAPECCILRLDPRRPPCYDVITPLRCLLLQRKHPERWKQLLSMEAHNKERGPETDTYKEIQKQVAGPLHNRYLQHLDSDVLEHRSVELIHQLCGILDVNALEIRLPEGNEIIAVYPTAFLMEHSCVPNTRHSFEMSPGSRQYRITVRAARNIFKGDHITTMYTHALWGTQARRDHLKSTKYFSCRCPRCSDPTELGTYLSALRCLGTTSNGEPCGGIHLPVFPLEDETEWHCDRCLMSLSSSQVAELVTHIGEEVDNVQQGSPTVKELEALLDKMSHLLHPHHYHCYSVKHSLVQLYGQQHGYKPEQLTESQIKRKIEMSRDLLKVTEMLDPGWARLALYGTVLQYELQSALLLLARKTGKNLAEAVKEGRSLLQEALKILEPEPEMSAGSKMSQLIQKALRGLEDIKL
ncbi:SET domain-containing protein SmydA-8 [Anabrus simplex]|uniref:SET domain-containing protein SmydA-8 n=1 Tax=Anabrus simplex TaxID=316456 RepID=UPI0035A26FFE